MSFTFFIILLLTVCATLNAQKFSNPTNSGGLIGNHGSIHSGGFTGTSGSISHGGFVGHRQNIGESGQGFVGHASSDKPSHGGLVGHHDARQTLIQNRRVLRAVSYGQNQQYRSPAVYAQSHRGRNAQSWQSDYRKPAAANYDYRVEEQEESPPKPYAFTYESDDVDGKKWSRQESRDANGIITGSYTIQAPYGEIRIVNYRADADGFHAEIQTNEPGMVDSEPANVIVRTISGGGNGAYANQPAYHRS